MTDYEVDPDDVYDPQISRLAEWTNATPEEVLSQILDDAVPRVYKQTKTDLEQSENQREEVARAAVSEGATAVDTDTTEDGGA